MWKGGESEAFRLRKAMAVVTDVRHTGFMLLRSDSAMAWLFSRPRRRPARTVVTMCIESATAIVMTMIGTPALIGLNTVPVHPARPIVVFTVKMSVRITATVASTERSSAIAATRMTRNTTGESVSMSLVVASAKARFITISPVA